MGFEIDRLVELVMFQYGCSTTERYRFIITFPSLADEVLIVFYSFVSIMDHSIMYH